MSKMEFQEENRKYREITGETTDFYLIVTHPSLKKRSIRAMGVDAYKNSVHVGKFIPKWHHMLYMIHGELSVEFDGKVLTARQGEILVNPAGMERVLFSDSKEIGWVWIHLEDVPAYSFLKSKGMQVRPYSEGQDLVKLYEMLRKESEGSILHTSYIEIISEKYLRALVDHQLKPYEAEFNLFWQKVREAPGSPWSVEMLCRRLNISKGHAHKLCASYFNSSPMEIINNIRLEYGAFLLKTSPKIIEEIAYECGFSSARSFSKSFLKKYELRPGKFRKQ